MRCSPRLVRIPPVSLCGWVESCRGDQNRGHIPNLVQADRYRIAKPDLFQCRRDSMVGDDLANSSDRQERRTCHRSWVGRRSSHQWIYRTQLPGELPMFARFDQFRAIRPRFPSSPEKRASASPDVAHALYSIAFTISSRSFGTWTALFANAARLTPRLPSFASKTAGSAVW